MFFVMGSFQMHASQDSQAGLGIIGIKRNRTRVVSVLHHLSARSDQLIAARNPAAGDVYRQQLVAVLTNIPAIPATTASSAVEVTTKR
jgi:hypothetical protein